MEHKVGRHPWYKERLLAKQIKWGKKSELAGSYDCRRWRFLRPNLDADWQGLPPVLTTASLLAYNAATQHAVSSSARSANSAADLEPHQMHEHRDVTTAQESQERLEPSAKVNDPDKRGWVDKKERLRLPAIDAHTASLDGLLVRVGSPRAEPVLFNSKKTGQGRRPNKSSGFVDQRRYLSRLTPLQQARRALVEETECGLREHPLALYPHLQQSLDPELFEEVVNLLDPEMRRFEASLQEDVEPPPVEQEDEEDMDNANGEDTKPEPYPIEDRPTTISSTREGRYQNPYRWLPKVEGSSKEDRRGRRKPPSGSSQDEDLKRVTHDFCDWVASLGGESDVIEESTLMSLFASGYETKPPLTVPIHVVELANVPPELRSAAGATPDSAPSTNAKGTSAHKTGAGPQPQSGRMCYGAWYLPPATWKKKPQNEPLEDPNVVQEREASEAKKRATAIDTQLLHLHGALAFRKFVDEKGARRPQFLEQVSMELSEEDGREQTSAGKARKRQTVEKGRQSSASTAAESVLN
ncbi:protein FAM47E [Petromyzon marinus]|uniref:protein FAM47E n=1 Tax=Petromyzon marinus TaxID=7757 RepID=UPI003F6EE38A